MSTTTRCGVIPPHLLQALAQSSNPDRARRARGTLIADTRHRTTRDLVARTTATTADAHTTGGEGEKKATPERVIHDAHGTEDLPGKEVRAEGEKESDDDSVNRAYDYLGTTYKFWRDVFARDSLDGKGLKLIGTVHFGQEYGNAFWDGKQMAFGDGDGDVFKDMTTDLTVIAHELAHGVVESTAKFLYVEQPGALNEHVADVFGVLTVQWSKKQTADEASWLIGESIFTGDVEGAALRSMKKPGSAYDDDILGKDPQPAHMDHYETTFADNGGVHINSGIPNHAFYQLATDLGGQAWETAGSIWYKTLTSGDVKEDANFKQFAKATHDTAIKLHGDGSAEAKAVAGAWDKVGITVA